MSTYLLVRYFRSAPAPTCLYDLYVLPLSSQVGSSSPSCTSCGTRRPRNTQNASLLASPASNWRPASPHPQSAQTTSTTAEGAHAWFQRNWAMRAQTQTSPRPGTRPSSAWRAAALTPTSRRRVVFRTRAPQPRFIPSSIGWLWILAWRGHRPTPASTHQLPVCVCTPVKLRTTLLFLSPVLGSVKLSVSCQIPTKHRLQWDWQSAVQSLKSLGKLQIQLTTLST